MVAAEKQRRACAYMTLYHSALKSKFWKLLMFHFLLHAICDVENLNLVFRTPIFYSQSFLQPRHSHFLSIFHWRYQIDWFVVKLVISYQHILLCLYSLRISLTLILVKNDQCEKNVRHIDGTNILNNKACESGNIRWKTFPGGNRGIEILFETNSTLSTAKRRNYQRDKRVIKCKRLKSF